MLRYNAMSSSPFDLLNAKVGEMEAGRRYIDATKRYWVARTRLEALRMGVEIRREEDMPRRDRMAFQNMRHEQ
ncbi:MAG: hypothetical protein AB7N71_15270 [Phycisphaerae bacterium]